VKAILQYQIEGREITFSLEKNVTKIGRSRSKNDLALDFDNEVSSLHAEIVKEGNKYFIRDLGSRNKTFVDGKEITEKTELRHNNIITTGNVHFKFIYGEPDIDSKPVLPQIYRPEQRKTPEKRGGKSFGKSIALIITVISLILFTCIFAQYYKKSENNLYACGSLYIEPEVVSNYPRAINFALAESSSPSVNLSSYLPPAGDQGNLGSCTAWAVAYAMRSGLAEKNWDWGNKDKKHQASPAYLYDKLLRMKDLPWGSGTDISDAFGILITDGCSSLYECPYSIERQSYYSEKDAHVFRIDSYKAVDFADGDSVKRELDKKNIIVFGARLYDDFMSYSGGLYRGSGKYLLTGSQHACHAMAVAGYDDNKQAYLIVNSWGTDWGEKGFMWMDYGTFEETAYVAFVAECWRDAPIPVVKPTSVPTPNIKPVPSPTARPVSNDMPACDIYRSFQFCDFLLTEYCYLYAEFIFDGPVFIDSITVVSPEGSRATQPYGLWFERGYVYFYRKDGYQFIPGEYKFIFNITDIDGKDWKISETSHIYSVEDYSGFVIDELEIPVSLKIKLEDRDFSKKNIYGMNQKPCKGD